MMIPMLLNNDGEDEATSDENVDENENADMVLKQESEESHDNHALKKGMTRLRRSLSIYMRKKAMLISASLGTMLNCVENCSCWVGN